MVSMLQSSVFFLEGCGDTMSPDKSHHTLRISVFRVHYLEQRLVVRYSMGKQRCNQGFLAPSDNGG